MKQPVKIHDQQGATLIVVMLVLLLIMVAGAMAVRQSRTDLQVATSDQINTVLLQTADNANQKLEQVINGDSTSEAYRNLVENSSGFVGYFYGRDDRANDEVVYCQTGQGQNYLVSSATVRRGSGTVYNNGYCANGSTLRYTSSRDTMVGQVSILPAEITNEDSEVLGSYNTGQDISGVASKSMKFDIYSTAAIPAYGNNGDVTGCFNNRSSKPDTSSSTRTVSECLEDIGVPQTSVYQRADISRITTAKVCQSFGTAAGEDSGTAVCQVN